MIRARKWLLTIGIACVCVAVPPASAEEGQKPQPKPEKVVQVRLQIEKDGKWVATVFPGGDKVSKSQSAAFAVKIQLLELKVPIARTEIVVFNNGASAEEVSKICDPIVESIRKFGKVETRNASVADVQNLESPPPTPAKPPDDRDIAMGFTGPKIPAIKNGDANGNRLAPFGVPGNGGGIGPRASFGGMTLNAMKIVLVCDASKNVLNFETLQEAQGAFAEGLKPIQSFAVINFQNGEPITADNKFLLLATPEAKLMTYQVIGKVSPKGNGDPTAALKMAFAMQPQAIIFAATGDWPDGKAIVDLARDLNKERHVRFFTLSLLKEPKESDKILETLAEETGGNFIRFGSGSNTDQKK